MKKYKLSWGTFAVLLTALMITSVFAIMPAMAGGGNCDCDCTCQCDTERIVLYPESAENDIGTSHTVTATLLDCCECSIEGRYVTFNVSGPNARQSNPVPTNATGVAIFTYTGTNVGNDTIVATMVGNCKCDCKCKCTCNTVTSNQATKEWVYPDPEIPEFPTMAIPVLSIIGLMFIMGRRRMK